MKTSFGALMLLVALAACDRIPGSSWQEIAYDKAIVANRMSDPLAVEFRRLKLVSQKAPSAAKALCGEFNAKNHAGGYTGFSRFIAQRLPAETVTLQPQPTVDPDAYAEADHLCKAKVDIMTNCMTALHGSLEQQGLDNFNQAFAQTCGPLPAD